jgi:MFS superfamily sulfate permease-like transporter
VHTVILDLDGNDEINVTGADALDKLIGDLGRQNVRVVLAHVHAPVADMLRRAAVGTAPADGGDGGLRELVPESRQRRSMGHGLAHGGGSM